MMATKNIRGLLVTNAFLKNGKFVEHYEWLREAARQQEIRLDLCDNAMLHAIYGMESDEAKLASYSFIIFWDKDIRLAKWMERYCQKRGIPIFNTPEAVAACDDKSETFRLLTEASEEVFSLIPSVVAPLTFATVGYTDVDFLSSIEKQIGYPMVIKECFGSFGWQVYLAKDREEALSYTKKLAGTPFLYQKFIAASAGVDVRLQVVGTEVVAAMKRRSKTDFRANLSNGGQMEAYEASQEECDLAVRAVLALGLDFAGVDLLFVSGEDKPANMICEVNSNAHFRNIAECTGVNTADKIMQYIKRVLEGKQERNHRG